MHTYARVTPIARPFPAIAWNHQVSATHMQVRLKLARECALWFPLSCTLRRVLPRHYCLRPSKLSLIHIGAHFTSSITYCSELFKKLENFITIQKSWMTNCINRQTLLHQSSLFVGFMAESAKLVSINI